MSAKKKVLAPEMELVLGAGGVKGYGHIGVLKSIEKHGIAISDVTGVSIGALIAALYCNGYTADEILRILAKETFLQEGARTLRRWQDALTLRSVFSSALTNLGPLMRKVVHKYKLVPSKRLKIVAYDVRSLSPVLFTGENCDDLGLAIASSCSVPLVMQPVVNGLAERKSVLVDGALHHTHPVQFCKGPAIVSKLGFASRLPLESLPAAEMLLHFAEMANCLVLDWYFGDPDGKHILIDAGMPDVATLSFSSSEKTCRKMVLHGERQTDRKLKRLVTARRLPLVS